MRPVGVTGVLPVIIYMRGGGWVLGDRQTHDRLLRELTSGIGAAVVFVDHQRSPEARLPGGNRTGLCRGEVCRGQCRKAERRRQPHDDRRR
jgi:acetyl esterase